MNQQSKAALEPQDQNTTSLKKRREDVKWQGNAGRPESSNGGGIGMTFMLDEAGQFDDAYKKLAKLYEGKPLSESLKVFGTGGAMGMDSYDDVFKHEDENKGKYERRKLRT